jgi:hypothetical protein
VTDGDDPPGRRRDVTIGGSVHVPPDTVEAHRAEIPRDPTDNGQADTGLDVPRKLP